MTSWTCHHANIGMVAEFDESLKKHQEIACQVANQRFGDAVAKLRRKPLAEAELLVALENGCQNQMIPDLARLRDQFKADYACYVGPWKVEMTGKGEGVVQSCMHWLDFPAWHLRSGLGDDLSPYGADEATLKEVVLDVIKIFNDSGPLGPIGLWNELRSESLWTRLVFGQAIAEKASDASTRGKILSGLREVIDLGIQSKDPQTRFTAVGSAGQLNMREFAKALQKMAALDDDPSVRGRAATVLAKFSAH